MGFSATHNLLQAEKARPSCSSISAFEPGKHWRKIMAVLGIEDPYIWGGYVISIVLAIVCAVYGLLNWNKEGEVEEGEEANG